MFGLLDRIEEGARNVIGAQCSGLGFIEKRRIDHARIDIGDPCAGA